MLTCYNTCIIYVKLLLYVDINECNNSPRPCEEVCTNIDGSYECSCNDSTRFVNANGSCTGNITLSLVFVKYISCILQM